MAVYATTLAGLRSRIIAETNRDDLADDLATGLDQAIADAIDFYAAEPWWFNQPRATATTTSGNEYVTKPSGARVQDRVMLLIGDVRYGMTKRSLAEIEGLYSSSSQGQPTDWCDYGTQVRLWPKPNAAYTLVWLGDSDVAALDYADDASSSYWTNQGAALICARAKVILYRDYLSAEATDPRLILAQSQEKEAYDRLKGETNRRVGTGRIRGSL